MASGCSRIIHIAANRAGLDDEAYRALLVGAAGVASSKDVRTWRQYDAIRKAFAALGVRMPYWKPLSSDDPQMGKAYALWCSLYDDGKVEDKSWSALMAFIKRQFAGQDILNNVQKSHLIEILKKWLEREA